VPRARQRPDRPATKAGTGKEIGVPISFYLKPITRAQLAQMWVAKYYPGRFLGLQGDDSGKPAEPAQAKK